MDIRLFRSFLVVAKLGNITHAAEKLHLTQPAVTFQIRTLEGHFGISLFERVGKKLVITSAGSELVGYAEKLLAIFDDMHSCLKSTNVRNDPIRLGSSTAVASYILPSIIKEFQARGIKGSIEFDVCTFIADTVKGILDNTYELSIVHDTLANNQIAQFPLFKERLVWVVHRDLLIRHGNNLDISNYPFLNYRKGSVFRAKYEHFLEEKSITPTFEYSDTVSITQAVLDGLGIGVIPHVAVAPYLENGTLIELPVQQQMTFDISLAFRKNKLFSPTIRALLAIFAEKANIENNLAEYLDSTR